MILKYYFKTKQIVLYLLSMKNIRLILTGILLSVSLTVFAQSLTLKGSVFDNHTHRFLPVKVFGIIASQKELLGSTVQQDVFEHRYEITVPLDTDSLVLEISGRPSICLPVYFHGSFEKNSAGTFLPIEIPVTNEEISQKVYSLLTQPETGTVGDNEFKLYFFQGEKYGYTGNINRILAHSGFSHVRDTLKTNSKYSLTVTSPEGELLTQNDFLPRTGINIVDANIYLQEKTIVQKTTEQPTLAEDTAEQPVPLQTQSVLAPHKYASEIPSIFFDQSKYELKSEGRNTLDSLLSYLGTKTEAKITVKGFTDNVGDAALNTTLARYRAQVVATYLTGKGLSSDRINIQWDETGVQTPTDTGLSRYRKVTITELN